MPYTALGRISIINALINENKYVMTPKSFPKQIANLTSTTPK